MDRTVASLVLAFMICTMIFGIMTAQLARQVIATSHANNTIIQNELQRILRP
jgi:preprotein translocase subunit SecG